MAAATSSSLASRAHGSEELSQKISRAVDEVGARSAMVVMVPKSIRVEEEEAAEEELLIRGLGFDGTPREVV